MDLKESVMKLSYRNFNWCVSWCITKVCNLKCTYCHYPYMPNYKHPDFDSRIKRLLEMKPKHLCINGGEPLMIPNIVDILKRLRTGLGEHFHLELNTNGILKERFLKILPYVNGICLSIDGVGEVNKIYRGFDGDALLDIFKEVTQYEPLPGQNFYITVVPVATEQTYKRLPELIERVQEIWKQGNCPFVAVDIKVVYPSSHPLSISAKKDVWQDFILRSVEWNDKFEIPVTVRGLAPASHLSPDGYKASSRCIRQFFVAILEENGHVTYCKPERYYSYYKDRIAGSRNCSEKARNFLKGFYTLVVDPYNPLCYFPCDHGEFLDEIFNSAKISEIAIKARERGVILSEADLKSAGSFIKRHFQKSLSMDFGNIVWRDGKPFYSESASNM